MVCDVIGVVSGMWGVGGTICSFVSKRACASVQNTQFTMTLEYGAWTSNAEAGREQEGRAREGEGRREGGESLAT